MKNVSFLLVLGFLFASLVPASAQYFGKNKARYETFKFDKMHTPHFDIYHYNRDRDYISDIGQKTELWYQMHKQVLRDSFNTANPVIYYNDHPDFQQTNAISSDIGTGTGGVTEALKNRVILPFTFTNQQTNHVIGHEMVHAFQYDIVINGDSTNLQSLQNVPLWMVEGLAEYMSKGRVDPFTAMWMRDAVVSEDVPELKDLVNPKYFPYRYGQAFWSFVAGFYGDDKIKPLYVNTAKFGLDQACRLVLESSVENLSSQFVNALNTYYKPFVEGKSKKPIGKAIFSHKNSGNINVAPVISPDGKELMFTSEKSLFSMDIFRARIRDSKILEKITSRNRDSHLDGSSYLESSGTWSPRGDKFAYVVVYRGKNVIYIKDVKSGKTLNKFALRNIPAVANPVWSPKGDYLLFTGLVQGQSNLYRVSVKSGVKAIKLTNDQYSDIQANFNHDGSKIVFSTDERSFKEGRTHGKYTFDIAILDVATGEKTILDIFHGADNLSPQFDHEGNILFLSDRDGYRNMYKYDVANDQVYQMTDYATGITGITAYSPALSVNTKMDKILYSYYLAGKYSIYETKSTQLLNKAVDKNDVDFAAGTLPVVGLDHSDIVNQNIDNIDDLALVDPSTFRKGKYKPKLKLDYIGGGVGAGVSSGNTFGSYTNAQGGVTLFFSDVLGNHQIISNLALNGEIFDIGGQVTYVNRTNRLAWGFTAGHIPQRTGYRSRPNKIDTLQSNVGPIPTYKLSTNIIRIFNEGLSGFVHYPFSRTLRLEGGIGASYRHFRHDRYDDYYLYQGNYLGQVVKQDRQKQQVGDQLNFGSLYTLNKGAGTSMNVALVGDNSFFGLTSPLDGHRFRIGADNYYGADSYYAALADIRKYFWYKPFSFAIRGMSYLKYPREGKEKTAYPQYIGTPGFIHGYGSLFNNEALNFSNEESYRLYGTKLAMVNAELRIPFTGPKGLSLIPSRFLLADLNFFFDMGTVFNEFSHFDTGVATRLRATNPDGSFQVDPNTGEVLYETKYLKPIIAKALGLGMRINLFGALILEPYYSWPLEDGRKGSFGVNIVPGW